MESFYINGIVQFKVYMSVNFYSLTDLSSIEDHDCGNRDDPCVRLKRDCVGLLAAFKLKDPSKHVLVVANTHIYW